MKIVVVEDNPGDARLICEMLAESRSEPYEVRHADRLAAGLTLVEEDPPDALVLDLDLPDSAGLETLRRARAHSPRLPILVLTGFDDEAAALAAVRLGADEYLVKGLINTHWLQRALASAVERCGTAAALATSERGRREAEDRLREARQLEEIGRLAGGVAHYFNNLMTVVLVDCDLLRREQPLGPEARGLVEEVHHAASRAATITAQLLAYARKRVQQPRCVDVNAELAVLEPTLRARLGAAQLELRCATALWPTRIDAAQLREVLLAFAAAAGATMPDGGRLTVTTANSELDEAGARRAAGLAPGRHVTIALGDTGPGMDEATRARIFEPFFSPRGLAGGDGLGLAASWGTVRQSGGAITVESAPGQGTTYTIYLCAMAAA